jgi:hypothetical protein
MTTQPDPSSLNTRLASCCTDLHRFPMAAHSSGRTSGLTKTEPSGRTDSGRFGLLLWISGLPER